MSQSWCDQFFCKRGPIEAQWLIPSSQPYFFDSLKFFFSEVFFVDPRLFYIWHTDFSFSWTITCHIFIFGIHKGLANTYDESRAEYNSSSLSVAPSHYKMSITFWHVPPLNTDNYLLLITQHDVRDEVITNQKATWICVTCHYTRVNKN